jgi:hypothetical protein
MFPQCNLQWISTFPFPILEKRKWGNQDGQGVLCGDELLFENSLLLCEGVCYTPYLIVPKSSNDGLMEFTTSASRYVAVTIITGLEQSFNTLLIRGARLLTDTRYSR